MFKRMRYKGLKYYSKYITPNAYKTVLRELTNFVLKPYDIEVKRESYRPAINEIIKNYSLFQNKKLLGVEIGVFYGYNALNILNTLNINTLFLVDIWQRSTRYNLDFNEPYNKVKALFQDNSKVKIIRGFSNKAVKVFMDKILDFVYIDGAHDYKSVLEDVSLWSNKVKENGIVAGHDIQLPEVFEAVKDFTKGEFIVKSPDWYFYKGE